MRVAVNLRHYWKGRIGGQENYLAHVIRGLEQAGHDLTIYAQPAQFEPVREFAPGAALAPAPPEDGHSLHEDLRDGGFALLFCPLLVLEPASPPLRSAVMMPDLLHEIHPDYFEAAELAWRRRSYPASAWNASVVLTCSESTRRGIVERYGIPESKVHVFPHGVDEELLRGAPDAEAFAALALPKNYVYFPANFWPHKNHRTLLRALALMVRESGEDLHLVLSGAAATGRQRVEDDIGSLQLQGRVRLLNHQSKAVVAAIYRHSRALVFATELEGFGIPVLEAMALGVPVITTRGGASEEVSGGAAWLVDDVRQPEQISAALRRVTTDEDLRARLVRQGLCRARDFSWERTVALTVRLLEDVAGGGYDTATPVEVKEPLWISVVALRRTGEPSIQETVESVRRQDYPRVDCVVVEGGAAGVNEAFRASAGQVFGLLQAGDRCLPGALSAVAETFLRTGRLGLVAGGERTAPLEYETLNAGLDAVAEGAFVSREAFAQAGGLRDRWRQRPDLDLCIRVAASNPVVRAGRALVTRWDGEDRQEREAAAREELDIVAEHFGYLPYGLAGSVRLSRGLWRNSGQRRRFLGEWAEAEIWHWQRRQLLVNVPAVARRIFIEAVPSERFWPPLVLRAKLGGVRLGVRAAAGPLQFRVRYAVPAGVGGGLVPLLVEWSLIGRAAEVREIRAEAAP